MKFSYNWLKEYVPRISDAKKLVGDLDARAFEVEGIEQTGQDWVLDIAVLPNRAFDCFSHLGIAREIAAIQDVKFKEPEFKLKEDKKVKAEDLLSVEVKDKSLCPRYSGRVVLDVKVAESPEWLKEKLIACGLRPINNIVDITNFVLLESGQPLHAFDLDKIPGGRIIVRRAKKDEKINTLDEGKAERILSENTLVIADQKKPIAIAGIKGGRGPEIDEKTRRVAIEAANFDEKSIRKSSRAIGLRTDASARFENGVDLNLTVWALDRAAILMAELAGGKIAQGIVDVQAKERRPLNNGVSHVYIESLLGTEIKSSEVLNIFERLGLSSEVIKKKDGVFYEVIVPTRRNDLNTQEDLIEEIGRLHGYENIPSKMPESVILPAVKDNELIYTDEIRGILVGLGYSEACNYSFVGEREVQKYEFENLVEVQNPLSQDQKYMRPNMAAGLIRNLSENRKYFQGGALAMKSLRLFEVGKVFEVKGKEISERQKIAGLVYLPESQSKNETFYEAKGAVDVLAEKLGLDNAWEDSYLEKGLPQNWRKILNASRAAEIVVAEERVGWLGELNADLLRELEISGRPAVFEIDFEKLAVAITGDHKYEPASRFPANIRDLSVLVEPEQKIQEVINVIENSAGELLDDVDLFDIYDQVSDPSAELKSLSFRLVFQSHERNLSDGEINEIMEKVISAVEEKGWEVRK